MLRSLPQEEGDVVEPDDQVTRTAERAVGLLKSGNARFVEGISTDHDSTQITAALASADPYAVVLGCSDSRVPPELIFDESVGRLFVIRVVSNVAGNEGIGAIEYALARWGCPLVVVLGHTQCGGIAAAMDPPPPGADAPPYAPGSVHLPSMLASIRTHLTWTVGSSPDPWTDAVRMNVRRTIEQLLAWSIPIRHRADTGALTLVGAIYHVETGEVEFIEG